MRLANNIVVQAKLLGYTFFGKFKQKLELRGYIWQENAL